jgi:halogenation protein CepH
MSKLQDGAYDLIVIGGGPAGSTIATFVAKQGHNVLLLEKSELPRYQVGESLLPSTINGICVMLGVDKEIHDAGFMKKLGGSFRWGKNPDPWSFNFGVLDEKRKNPAFAYQVERSKFDYILLKNARKNGVEVKSHCAVNRTLKENGRVCGVEYRDENGVVRTAHSRYVADASGNTSVIAKSIGERIYSKFFRNFALFGYYENGKRFSHPREGNILSAAFDEGWFWYIPITPTMTSVGAVFHAPADGSKPRALLKGNLDDAMKAFIKRCPIIEDFLKDATRITEGPYGQLRVRKDWSYTNSKFYEDGLVLLGDAACFVDPLLSQGVHLATYSALLAARSINSCLAGTISEEMAFTEFETRYRREYGLFYQYLTSLYDMNADEDSFFWAARSLLKTEERGNEAFVRLLAGQANADPSIAVAQDFFDARAGSGAMLEKIMNPATGNIDGADDSSNVHTFLPNLDYEAAQMQLLTKINDARPVEMPVYEGGLITSMDGMHWSKPESGSVVAEMAVESKSGTLSA